ncbi:glycoside hydrolase family 43 protein [Aaosphaeria arxii CBS 175.79]|uniref:Glycoside hydrolase family 43 protein n=1 Tax=Aaosphaeria arxii CBS 175.79 TaxID=1450172 RepID=A0A6A5XDB1_9PLEO|nr:glycoside hydrolase family 43 protein [Aaosphaeria arxii CBS 175.79]KAF2010853.1 glycoside hydrolase family 43 protein [Aaosphaeria arxii CBS 175.79]
MLHIYTLLLTVGFLGHYVSGFRNPIISGVNADPTAIRVGDDYFLVTSSFEYFPGLPIYHSTDLVDWKIIGHGLTIKNAIYDRQLLASGGIFAPTLRHYNGTFYLITNYADSFNPSDQRPFLITTNDIFSGNWSMPTYFDQTGIDPDLFFDDDGCVYLSTALPEFAPTGGNSTIWQSQVDVTSGKSLIQPVMIYRSDLPLKIRWAEGPHVYKINGSYYLSVAEGGTEVLHRQTIHRGPSPSGPWEASPLGPLLFNGRDTSAPVQQTGHADLIVRPDGKWYSVFLAVRPQNPNNINGSWILGRETYLSPVTWSEDGWPLANNGSEITFEMADPDIAATSIENTTWHDTFSSSVLDPSWEFRGTPYGDWYRINDSSLVLRGTPRALDALDGMALVIRRQDSLWHDFSADLEFQPTLESHEAGVVAWVNDEYHNTISVVLCKDQPSSVCLKTATIGQGIEIDGNVTTTYHPLGTEHVSDEGVAVRIYISATPETYKFGYLPLGSENVTWVTAFPSSWMAARSGGRTSWHGARMGLYATGNGFPMLKEAVFKNVEAVSNYK